MVNAHTHLELTDIGPKPYDPAGGFVGWVKMLRDNNPADFVERRESAGRGALRAKAAGVQAVGDIASSLVYAVTRMNRGVLGQTYAELFGIDPGVAADSLPSFLPPHEAEAGLQPHAPYSAGPALYASAASTGRPVSTHLAETQEEARFVAQGDGPWLDYLKSLGKWDDAFAAYYGQGLSPVQWMRPHLEAAANDGGWVVAHCNYVSDEDIRILADTNTSVAYCPIASEYFGHTGHRYRDMLAAGVNVCLGTDSIVCALPDDPQPLGLLSAMRRLYARDGTEPDTLLQMATVNGARALRMPDTAATLRPGASAKFALIDFDTDKEEDGLRQAMVSDALVEWLDLT
ncbi:MAG: amidohydrolase family protein [Planctomycetota bacterium]